MPPLPVSLLGVPKAISERIGTSDTSDGGRFLTSDAIDAEERDGKRLALVTGVAA